MANKDKLVPRSPNEVVVPVGKANLVTTKEEIDEALETASHIFRKQSEENMEINDIHTDEAPNAEGQHAGEGGTGETAATEEDLLVELTEDELKALPAAKFGRDKYGRALNKDKTPRKARNDKGKVRGKYGPRQPKTVPTEENATPAPVAEAAYAPVVQGEE